MGDRRKASPGKATWTTKLSELVLEIGTKFRVTAGTASKTYKSIIIESSIYIENTSPTSPNVPCLLALRAGPNATSDTTGPRPKVKHGSLQACHKCGARRGFNGSWWRNKKLSPGAYFSEIFWSSRHWSWVKSATLNKLELWDAVLQFLFIACLVTISNHYRRADGKNMQERAPWISVNIG